MAIRAAWSDDPRRHSGGWGRVPLVVAVVLVVAHLPFLGAPYVNTEQWTGVAAGQVFEGSLHRGLATYRLGVSSPPFFFFSIVPFFAAFGVTEFAARLSTVLSAALAACAVYVLGARSFGSKIGALACVLIAANPLFWTYAGVICCNDAFFTLVTALLLVALVRAADGASASAHALAGLALGVTLITKFNAGVYPIAIAAVLFPRWKDLVPDRTPRGFLRIALAYVPGLAIPVVYYAALVASTGHIINPNVAPTNVSRAGGWTLSVVPRLGFYLAWIGLFTGPMLLPLAVRFWCRSRAAGVFRALAVAIPLNIALVAWMNYALAHAGDDLGELRFGYIEHLLPRAALWCFQFLGVAAGELVVSSLWSWGRSAPGPRRVITTWTVAVLVCDSFWRGAERYMVYLLPGTVVFLAAVALEESGSRARRAVAALGVAGTVIVGVSFGVFSNAYFAEEGRAAAAVATFIESRELRGIDYEGSGNVLCHCAYRVDPDRYARAGETPRYAVMSYGRRESTQGAIYTSDVRLLGTVFKRYGVIELPESTPPLTANPSPPSLR